MVFEITTSLDAVEVFSRAKRFFAERVPQYSAYPEKESERFLLLRGQGGEEIVLAAIGSGTPTHIRASTLLFDQQLDRFLSTLPAAAASDAVA